MSKVRWKWSLDDSLAMRSILRKLLTRVCCEDVFLLFCYARVVGEGFSLSVLWDYVGIRHDWQSLSKAFSLVAVSGIRLNLVVFAVELASWVRFEVVAVLAGDVKLSY